MYKLYPIMMRTSLLFCIAFFFSLPSIAQNCPATYVEKNGFVVIEAEAANNLPSAWNRRTSLSGYTGSGYLRYEGTDNFNTPGRNVYTFKFYVASAGTFRFQWRNRIAKGTNTNEHNDSWLRFPDAADFYAKKGSSILYPKGSGKSPNPRGAGGDGWFKIYSNQLNWSYETETSDFDPHNIFVRFGNAGVYTIEVAGRSNGHAIDRLVLYRTSKSTSEATNPSLAVTRCSDSDVPNKSPVVQAGSDKTVQLPDNDLTLSATASDSDGSISSYAWSKVSGPSVTLNGRNSRSLQLTNLVEGTYEFRVTVKDNDGASASDNVKVFVKAESDPDPPVSTSVTLSLYNAQTDQPISGFDPIPNGAIVDLSKTGESLTIVANTTGDVGSVTFNYNGQFGYKVEGLAPYCIAGDIGDDLLPWNYELGSNTLEALVNSSGDVVASTQVSFSIVDGTSDPEPPVTDDVTLTLINTNTSNPVAGFDPLLDGDIVDISQVTNNLSIVANVPADAARVFFSYNGVQDYKKEYLAPFAIAGDNGANDIQPWNYELGDNDVTATVYNSSGNIIARNTVTFTITDGADNPEPPVSDGVTLTLINTNTSEPVAGFNPLADGDVVDLSRVGNDLSIIANVSTGADRVFFSYNGDQNYKKEYLAPFAIAGDNGPNDIQPWNYELGDNNVTATVYNSSGDIIARNTVSFTIAEDVINPEPPVVEGEVTLTLYNAVTDTPINGFDPMSDGQTIDISQTGKSLSIVANASSEADRVKFNLNGSIVGVEGLAPYSIAGDNGDDLLPYTFPLGGNRLTAIVEDNSGTVIAEKTITFDVVDGSNARFAGVSKPKNSSINPGLKESISTNPKVLIHPNPAKDYVNISIENDAVVTFYSNTGRVIRSLKLSEGNVKVDVADLKPGVYNLQVQEPGGMNFYKFIKR